MTAAIAIEAGDVVAVRLPPGEPWREIVAAAWTAGAALLPVDHRLPEAAAAAVIAQARATIVIGADRCSRTGSPKPEKGGNGLIIATSGSAGGPRLVEIGRDAVTAAVQASATALGARPGDGWVSQLPPAHIGGMLVLLRGLLLDALVRFRSARDPLAPAPSAGFAFTAMVPASLARALDAGVDLRGYRAILVGGSGLPHHLAQRAAAAGARCVSTYGLTESCGGVVYDGVALPGVAVRIGAEGEVQLAGPTLMSSYRDDPEGTREALVPGGWLRTRDAGVIDGSGRLRVVGRLDEVIVTGGEKVWPAEVEAVLREHPDVLDIAVLARPDAHWGERVVAVVVPRRRPSPPSLASLRDLAGSRLGRHQAPRELILAERLPRTALGKLARGELRLDGPGALPSVIWEDRGR